MSRKIQRPYNLLLALVVLIGLAGVLVASSLNVRVSMAGAIIVTTASLESALILGSIALLSRRQANSAAAGDSD